MDWETITPEAAWVAKHVYSTKFWSREQPFEIEDGRNRPGGGRVPDAMLSRLLADYLMTSTSLGRQVLAKNGSSGL